MVKKEEALMKRGPEDNVLYTKNFSAFLWTKTYENFLQIIKDAKNRHFCEYIFEKNPVNFFYDIDIKESDNPDQFKDYKDIIKEIIKTTSDFFTSKGLKFKVVVLKSHTNKNNVNLSHKKSFHIIYVGVHCSVLCCASIVNHLFSKSNLLALGIVDPSVYREGNFRAYLCSKPGESRPLVRSKIGDQDYQDVETFVQYDAQENILTEDILGIPKNISKTRGFKEKGIGKGKGKGKETMKGKVTSIKSKKAKVSEASSSNSPVMNHNDATEYSEASSSNSSMPVINHTDDPEYVVLSSDSAEYKVICNYINYHYHHPKILNVKLYPKEAKISVGTLETYCNFKNEEHKSNHQFFLLLLDGSHQMCHDSDCLGKKYKTLPFAKYPSELQSIFQQFDTKSIEAARKLIQDSEMESTDFVKKSFDNGIDGMIYDPEKKYFAALASEECQIVVRGGVCEKCNLQHRVTGSEYCLECLECNARFPTQMDVFPIDTSQYVNLNNFQINYSNQINGNVTIITNHYAAEEDFSCDVSLDIKCGTGDLTPLYNLILDGHKTAKISELLYKMDADFVYACGNFYHFNGCIWKLDKEQLTLKKSTLDLTKNFSHIKSYYEDQPVCETNAAIIKNLKSLITKLNKPSLKNDIISEAKMFFYDENFYRLLNSKKHLVPFTNGVFDLVKREFRRTEKKDYINLTMGFDYNPEVNNPEINEFLCKILPDLHVRNYVLKKMSECLNGDIPNTHFLMFIGDGANGKSQLLNLMKLVMGEFGEKIEVTLLTRKRNNANEANPEKIKLVNKRFGFLSEPEDGEKLNIGLLKELTGSEEIVSRGLYEGSFTFVMETKLFLACNDLPDINNSDDNAIWRRIRVVDFPSRFVDEPVASNEFLIDRTLPARMREDISWRQTFVNILLEYHYRVIAEPEAVKMRTNQYKEETNEVAQWVNDNIIYEKGSFLDQKELYERYYPNPRVGTKEKSKFKREFLKVILHSFPSINLELTFKKKNGIPCWFWEDIRLR